MKTNEAYTVVRRAEDAGWAAVQIAEYLGCTTRTLSGWRADGGRKVSLALRRNVEKLARLLDRRGAK